VGQDQATGSGLAVVCGECGALIRHSDHPDHMIASAVWSVCPRCRGRRARAEGALRVVRIDAYLKRAHGATRNLKMVARLPWSLAGGLCFRVKLGDVPVLLIRPPSEDGGEDPRDLDPDDYGIPSGSVRVGRNGGRGCNRRQIVVNMGRLSGLLRPGSAEARAVQLPDRTVVMYLWQDPAEEQGDGWDG
jgi:hypothetical protein